MHSFHCTMTLLSVTVKSHITADNRSRSCALSNVWADVNDTDLQLFCRTYLHCSNFSSIYIVCMMVSCQSLPCVNRPELSSLSFWYVHRVIKHNAAKFKPRTVSLLGFNMYCVANISTLTTSCNFCLLPAWLYDRMSQVQNFATLLSVGLLSIIFISR